MCFHSCREYTQRIQCKLMRILPSFGSSKGNKRFQTVFCGNYFSIHLKKKNNSIWKNIPPSVPCGISNQTCRGKNKTLCGKSRNLSALFQKLLFWNSPEELESLWKIWNIEGCWMPGEGGSHWKGKTKSRTKVGKFLHSLWACNPTFRHHPGKISPGHHSILSRMIWKRRQGVCFWKNSFREGKCPFKSFLQVILRDISPNHQRAAKYCNVWSPSEKFPPGKRFKDKGEIKSVSGKGWRLQVLRIQGQEWQGEFEMALWGIAEWTQTVEK